MWSEASFPEQQDLIYHLPQVVLGMHKEVSVNMGMAGRDA